MWIRKSYAKFSISLHLSVTKPLIKKIHGHLNLEQWKIIQVLIIIKAVTLDVMITPDLRQLAST